MMAILPADEARIEHAVEVVIIGAGACGICAGLAAQEAGSEVLVLERDKRPTGSTALSTGLIPAAGTRLQKRLGIEDSPERFADDIIRKAKGETDAAMALAVSKASGPTVDWLADRHDVPFSLVEGFLYPGHTRLRMHGPPGRTGEELEKHLLAASERSSLDIVTDATARDLYATPDGWIMGVRFARPDGSLETVGCEALVLACNGFGGNKGMLRRYIPEIADAEYWGHTGNLGDAMTWGEALGVAVADMGSYQGHGAVATPHGRPIMWGILTEGGFQVNDAGRRFSNETRGYSEQAVEVIAQPGRVAWNIYDEERERPALDFTDYREVAALGGIKKAETVDALSAMLNLPAEALAATMADVDAMRAGQRQDRFGRDFTGTQPLRAPLCAVKVTGALFHTQGGLVVDTGARALRHDGTGMPNLFAGGGAARGLSGPSRWGYLSGNGLLTATVLGRVAGQSAAAQVRREIAHPISDSG
jgi:fumarate reductase flavoprotein subunit